MTGQVDSPYVARRAAAAITRGRGVKHTTTTVNGATVLAVTPCGQAEIAEAIACEDIASGAVGTVKLLPSSGTFMVQVNEAVSIGARLYCSTLGKFSDTSTSNGVIQMLALEAATADGDIIEAMWCRAAS